MNRKSSPLARCLPFMLLFVAGFLMVDAAVPKLLNHQGRIAVDGMNFDGTGQFKFALVDATGATTFWSNDGTSNAGGQPTAAVSLGVVRGLYSVLLGDASISNMTAVPAAVFENTDVRLRVWFNDGSHGFQLISPDQRMAASPYALAAENAALATSFSGSLAGDVSGTQAATSIAASTVTGKLLTGFSSAAGNLSADDTILAAFNKLDGNTKLKANLDSPTFTGSVGGITPAMVGLGNVTNTSDANKPVSTAQQTALNLKANLASPTFTGTTSGNFSGPLTGNVTGNVSGNSASFTGLLDGDVTGTQSATAISAATVTGKALTGYVSNAGILSASDSILTAINKLNGNDAFKANLASPQFTGTVRLPAGSTSAAPLRLALGTNLTTAVFGSIEFDGTNLYLTNNSATPTRKTIAYTDSVIANGAVGSSQLASGLTLGGTTTGTFSGPLSGNVTGNVSGSAGSFTGTLAGDVTGTQSATVISAATVTGKALTGYVSGAGPLSTTDTILSAINKLNGNDALKANLASPTFSGTVSLPAGTGSSAPLKLAAGTSLTSASFGAVEFDGTNLYLTTNSASPTRKTLAFTDSVPSLIPMTSLTAAPIVPVLAWGNHGAGQTSMPALANVAAIAAGESHSLVLLDAGTVLARGLNTSGQVTIPAGLTGVTEIAAGASHNLVRKSDGTLVSWGDNSYGQTTIPAGITTATQVAAGEKHSLALLANGSVRAWGDNSFGQTTLPASLTGATVTAIAAGSDHSLALKSDGTVIAWGRDDAGQVTLPEGLSGVTAIAAGAYHSLALKSDGTVVAWGWDGGGQVTIPEGLGGVTKLAGGYAFSMALKTDGTLVLWGDNSDGQTTAPAAATQVTHIAAGATHALALRADSIPAQVARLDQDNVFSAKVGIKRTPAVNSLEVEGSASKTTAGSWLSNSDRRIKTEIQSITGALEKLDQVRLVDFRYTDEYRAVHPSIEDVRYPNVIAQEFAEVFPADVKNSGEVMADGSPILQVDTYPLIIYSAAAVQELNQENQKLKKQLADQEKRLRKLEALLGE
jgi:hypothetical protein